MKKTLSLFILLISFSISFADSWTDMTLGQAKKAVEHLKENPYIFDYCDCCDMETVNLIFVENVYYQEVEEFSDIYEVRVEGKIIHSFYFTVFNDEVAVLEDFMPALSEEQIMEGMTTEFNEIISANYTFVFYETAEGEAYSKPLMDITGYNEYLTSCIPFMIYPYPVEEQAPNQGYSKWYEKILN